MLQRWFDPRLIHENRKKTPGYLNGLHHLKHIWRPPAISQAQENTENTNTAMEIYPNGTIVTITRFVLPLKFSGS